jgi:hypothetical protein
VLLLLHGGAELQEVLGHILLCGLENIDQSVIMLSVYMI